MRPTNQGFLITRLVAIMVVMLLTGCGDNSGGVAVTPLGTFVVPATSTPDVTLTPTTPPVTDTPTIPPENCVYDSEYLSDVNVPDGTEVAPGDTFIKTWRMRNNGTCPWTADFQIVQTSGDPLLISPQPAPLVNAQPGQEVDISVSMQLSPDAPLGTQQIATFQMRDPQGNFFGGTPYVMITVSSQSAVQVNPTFTPTPASITAGGSVTGTVYSDICPTGGSRTNCVDNGQGELQGNGTLDTGEQGIEGIVVRLRIGACPGSLSIFATATTGADGQYTFTDVAAGIYCVEINALDPATNQGRLVPGFWTQPGDVVGSIAHNTVDLPEGQVISDINFGWDYLSD